jgi:hypothetical protein
MLSAILFFTAVLSAPPAAPSPAAAQQDDPAVRIWLSDDGRYQRGDRAKVEVKAREDGYLVVLNVDPDGRLRVLFPLDPSDDALIRGGKKYEILGRGDREAFTIDQRSGHGTVYAAISHDPFNFQGYVTGDHWDLTALGDVRISDKPETDLNAFVQRIARSDFDYDILGYDVYENVVYGSGTTVNEYNYGPMLYSDGYGDYGYGCYSYWGCGGSSIFIGIGFGHRHRFYDPFFYDPFFYSPFFYSPYYYPAYYYPRSYYPGYRYPFHRYPYASYPGYRYPGGRAPFGTYYSTPWRRRGVDPVVASGFQWRAREIATRTPTNGSLASAYRAPIDARPRAAGVPTPRPARGSFAGMPSPVRNRERLDAAPRRSLDPRSNEIVLTNVPERGPVGRRAVDRPGNPVPQPQRVRSGADDQVGRSQVTGRPANVRPANMPTRVPEARPAAPQIRDRNESRGAPVTGRGDRSAYEGTRVITPRAPEARRAEDERPASRPNIERVQNMERGQNIERGQMSAPSGRVEPRGDPSPARAEPSNSPPPARMEPRQQESRPAPAARGGNDGGGGRSAGGGAPSDRGGGGGWGGHGGGGGGGRGAGGGGGGLGGGGGGRHR